MDGVFAVGNRGMKFPHAEFEDLLENERDSSPDGIIRELTNGGVLSTGSCRNSLRPQFLSHEIRNSQNMAEAVRKKMNSFVHNEITAKQTLKM